ncbi:unnamed protein product [Thlaspi arvense]|uniref:Uncharacterized protein n=1 Tax=Thlaspi arvense TaxID=13288 RepID=A0AAU9S8S3_THLAR|nr:unnamed protein product [Thlaspi arvense]
MELQEVAVRSFLPGNAMQPNRYQSSLRLVKDVTAASSKCQMLHFAVTHVAEL